MNKFLGVLSVLAVATTVSGCGNLESIFRTTSAKNFNASFVDAKQRGVLVTQAKDGPRACAEPSPDALASVAASFSASGNVDGQAAAALASSLSGSAASIGLRTQSIQLMRDALYRLCEAYAAGAISPFQMRSLQFRYQNMIVGLLAIEQLTGAVRGPTATTGGGSTAAAGSDPVAIAQQLEIQAKRRDALRPELQKRQAAETEANEDLASAKDAQANLAADASDSAKETAQKNVDTAQTNADLATQARAATEQDIADTEQSLEALRQAMTAAQNASTSSQSNATSQQATVSTPLNAQTADTIASAVQGIVTTVVTQDNSLEGCIEMMDDLATGRMRNSDATEAVLAFCSVKLKSEAADLQQLLGEFGGDKLNQLVVWLSSGATRARALNAFPAQRPASIQISDEAYADMVSDLKQNSGGGVIRIILDDSLKSAGDARDLRNVDAAFALVQARVG